VWKHFNVIPSTGVTHRLERTETPFSLANRNDVFWTSGLLVNLQLLTAFNMDPPPRDHLFNMDPSPCDHLFTNYADADSKVLQRVRYLYKVVDVISPLILTVWDRSGQF